MPFRANIRTFALANDAYIAATVNFFTVVAGVKTATLASLYDAPTGSTTLPNPQTLDSEGKLIQPVYVDEDVVATITSLGVADHDTGILGAEVLATLEAAYRAENYAALAQSGILQVTRSALQARAAATEAAASEAQAFFSANSDYVLAIEEERKAHKHATEAAQSALDAASYDLAGFILNTQVFG